MAMFQAGAERFDGNHNWQIKQTSVCLQEGTLWVSTVFLPWVATTDEQGRPTLFETMVELTVGGKTRWTDLRDRQSNRAGRGPVSQRSVALLHERSVAPRGETADQFGGGLGRRGLREGG